MPATIDYYLTAASPFVYLGHAAIKAVADKHGAQLNIKPINIGGLFEASGSVPLAKRSATRLRYRFLELQRFAEHRGMAMNFKPKFAPVDPTSADLTIATLLLEGHDPFAFIGRIGAAYWSEERDISAEAVLRELLVAEKFNPDAVLERARSESAVALREQNTRDAIAADAIGAPVYVLNGEAFWGQDRIDLLDSALESGRNPFVPL